MLNLNPPPSGMDTRRLKQYLLDVGMGEFMTGIDIYFWYILIPYGVISTLVLAVWAVINEIF